MSLGCGRLCERRWRVCPVFTNVVGDAFDRCAKRGFAFTAVFALAAADAVTGIDADRFAISEKRRQLVVLAGPATAGNAREGHGKVSERNVPLWKG